MSMTLKPIKSKLPTFLINSSRPCKMNIRKWKHRKWFPVWKWFPNYLYSKFSKKYLRFRGMETNWRHEIQTSHNLLYMTSIWYKNIFKVPQVFRTKFYKNQLKRLKNWILKVFALYPEVLILRSLYLTSWNSSWYDVRKS